MDRSPRAKLKDVAEAADVSISTVSRVFSNPDRISPATVLHVKQVAERLRFTPNVVARALITGVGANIGLVVPDITNPYMTHLLKAAQGRSRSSDIGILVADTDDNARIERDVAEHLSAQSRGLILCAPRMSAANITSLADRVPVVITDRLVKGVASVVAESGPALEEIVDGLVEQGHECLAYLPGPKQSWADRQRRRAIANRAQKSGVELCVLPATHATYADGVAAADALVSSGATAVLAFDDVLAAGLVEGLRRSGRRVPDDISVIGHDDLLAELVAPGLTSVRSHSDRIGRLAVELLLAANGEVPQPDSVIVHAEVVHRASVSPPRG